MREQLPAGCWEEHEIYLSVLVVGEIRQGIELLRRKDHDTNVPHPLPTVDGLLAATAKVSHLVLATRNVDDIKTTGVSYVNPFDT